MSSISDEPTSDDGEPTEPLALVEATLDDGEHDEPETATGVNQSDELQPTEKPNEDSSSVEPRTSEQRKSDQPPPDERVAPLVPKRGRPLAPRTVRPPRGSRPRGRPPLASYGPRMPGPASDTHKSMLQMSQPKTHSVSSNCTTPPTPSVASPISTPLVQLPTPSNPPRPRRGRPSLASQTPRMPGPASEFYRALVDMHDCLKWDRKVLYRYERRPAPSEQSQNGDGTRQPTQDNRVADNRALSAQQVHKEYTIVAEPAVTLQVPKGTGGNGDENSTPPQMNNDRSGAMATPEVKEEPVQEENVVAIGSSFSLTDVPSEARPQRSETPSTRDKDDSNGNTSGGGSANILKRFSGASSYASVSTFYLLGSNRGLNRKCVVPSCIRPLDPHFSFPKDKNLCLKWLLAIPKGSWSLNEHSVVCARHFDRTNINWKTRMANSVTLTVDAVPKLYLLSPVTPQGCPPSKTATPAPASTRKNTALSTENTPLSTAAADSSAKGTADSPTADGSVTADISETQDVSLVQQGNGVFKIQMGDDDSGSDLEIIEPHIETYEVSDTSDEGESTENKGEKDTAGAKDGKSNLPISIVGVNSRKDVSSTGQLYNRRVDGDIIKCCVPRCGSYTGSPAGVGFHTFPVVGETRLSVRSLDNKVTVHDLCSMWKSLLSVSNVTEDSYVCTRHFTVNDYIYNTLNKAAVPTQFLPTPVMFAPCRVEKSMVPQSPHLVFVRNPQQPNRSTTIKIRAPTILRGAPRVGSPSTLGQIHNRILHHVAVGPNNRHQAPGTQRVMSTLPRSTITMSTRVTPPVQPKPAVMRLGCAIPDCPNKTYEDGSKPIFFRLPSGIEKCKEWVYSCGHPEWLDKGMFFARAKFRICAEHFPDEMFLGSDRKMLKGFAKPCIKVQEPYKKCIVKSCHNYYDKERLHHIGVDFSPFPDRENAEERLIQWIQAVKSSDHDVAEEELKKYENSVICSLHFRNSDYISGPVGKRLSNTAVPSMNLVRKDPLLLDDNEGQRGEEEPEQKKMCLSSHRKSRRRMAKLMAEKRRKTMEEKRKALAEGRPWPPVSSEEAERPALETCVAEEKEKRREEKKKRWEALTDKENKRQLGEEADGQSEGGSQHGFEAPGSSHRKQQGRGRKTRCRREHSEDSSGDESRDGSWVSENEGRQLRFGRKSLPLRQAALTPSKRGKYADSEDGESSSSGRRRRKQPRLEEETIYAQAPVTRASARAAAAKNKKIYAEDSNSDNQQDDNDQGVPDEEYSPRQEIERPQGTHFLDPDFGGLEDMAVDSMDMDTLENCLETVLNEESHENSLGPPDLGPPEKVENDLETHQNKNENSEKTKDSEVQEKRKGALETSWNKDGNSEETKDSEVSGKMDNALETDQNKDEFSERTKDPEVSEKNPDASSKKDGVKVEAVSEGNQIEAEAVVEGRQLRFGRKARAVPQYYPPKRRRGRRGRSKAAEEANPQADDSDRNNSEAVNESLQAVGDVDNTDGRVPMPAEFGEGSKQQSAKKSGSSREPNAGADLAGDDISEQPPTGRDNLSEVMESSQKENSDEIPTNQDAVASPQKHEDSDPVLEKTNPSGEKPSQSPRSDESQDPSHDDSKANDDTICIPYGPKMAEPTQADVEFFRSVIPTVAKFNQHQRAILKATVLSTLKDMLGEDVGVSLNTTEVLLSALPLPASPE